MKLLTRHDEGCQNVIFVDYAYGFRNLEVGNIVIPEKSYHFEGIYHPLEPDRKVDSPDKKLKKILEELSQKKEINFVNGINISVPAVTFQLPHANEEYRKIKPSSVEMEQHLAAIIEDPNDITNVYRKKK